MAPFSSSSFSSSAAAAAATAISRPPEPPWPYPFAAAVYMVRAQQKDAFFSGQVATALADLYRRMGGARAAHARAAELRALAALLYLGLTTLAGNRTLGEEYCDLVLVHGSAARLPSARVRAAYVAAAAAGPLLVARWLPRWRAWLRTVVERRREALQARRLAASSSHSPPSSSADGSSSSSPCREARLLDYLARNLPDLTSTAPLQAVTLALFYLHGSYYELPKRLLSLRYLFARSVPDTPDRAGYEVLGVLLGLQLAVQACLHIRANLAPPLPFPSPAVQPGVAVDLSVNPAHAYAASGDLPLTELAARGPQASRVDLAATTHTPPAHRPRFDLANDSVMPYIRGPQQRKCTLCLDELKDPSATPCGHVFCWLCIADWAREKPECPLCRREAMVQHILPLRTM